MGRGGPRYRQRIADGARHWWDYLWGRIETHTSLRYSFALGLVATTLVTLFTYIAVGLGPGIEANPLMGWLIDAHGWVAFVGLRYAVVIGLFALVWPLASMDAPWPDWSESNGRMIAAILWVNAVRDGIVLATGVHPSFVLLRLLGLF